MSPGRDRHATKCGVFAPRAGIDVASALLEIRHLSVSYPGPRGPVPALRDFSLEVLSGETLALVGDTGCGKSTVALATLGLV
ncbi:MAG: glutathione ABC transporter ATP-binding protein GsiA, partial [Acidobacteria bacterium]